MDIREKIINDVVEDIREKVSEADLLLVQDALVIQLNKYELQERCTDVALVQYFFDNHILYSSIF